MSSPDGPIERILILGGGTSGWLSAAYLQRALGRGGPPCEITVVEAEDITTVGVGEATVPTMPDTLRFLGIDEREFMRACGATFKASIRFVNWNGGGAGDVFWHPFADPPGSEILELGLHQRWLQLPPEERGTFSERCFVNAAICAGRHAVRPLGAPDYSGEELFAYHFDAGRLAAFLKQRVTALGVRHKLARISGASRTPEGALAALHTTEGERLEADLFIDCSGFGGLLINRVLGEPFESFGDSLLCDRAVAAQVPYPRPDAAVEPYTTSTALSAGWTWRTPLRDRTGNGYVYSSRFIDDAAAEAELRCHLGPAAEHCDTRLLRMRVGHNRRAWVHNCVSIGLSSGFVEPLESTGIYLVEMGLMHLLHLFPSRRMEPRLRDEYNRLMAAQYAEALEFLVLHYCLSPRRDTPFWRAAAEECVLPDGLAEKLELWAQTWPNDALHSPALFPEFSVCCMLSGFGRLPARPLRARLSDGPWVELQRVDAVKRRIRETFPGHRAFLDQL